MKKNKAPSIVAIAVLTLITTVFWIFFSVLRIFSTKPPASVPDEILTPINPTLDTKALNSLEQRYYLEEGQIPEFQYSPSGAAGGEVVEEEPITETPPSSPAPQESPEITGEL